MLFFLKFQIYVRVEKWIIKKNYFGKYHVQYFLKIYYINVYIFKLTGLIMKKIKDN